MTDLFTGDTALWVLFTTGFLSATLLPGGSEANLIAAIELGDNPLWALLAVATIGNTLGGLTNYGLGRLVPQTQSASDRTQKAIQWASRYGYWSLLFSWLPIIGDPLCLAAGWLRMKFWWCLTAICIGKALRYTGLAIFVLSDPWTWFQ